MNLLNVQLTELTKYFRTKQKWKYNKLCTTRHCQCLSPQHECQSCRLTLDGSDIDTLHCIHVDLPDQQWTWHCHIHVDHDVETFHLRSCTTCHLQHSPLMICIVSQNKTCHLYVHHNFNSCSDDFLQQSAQLVLQPLYMLQQIRLSVHSSACLSVRHTPVCVKTRECRRMQSSPSGRPVSLVFWC